MHIFMLYIHPHNTKSQNNDYRSTCVREEQFHCSICKCVLYTPANLNTAKLQIIRHYFTKPGLLEMGSFPQPTLFKHIFLIFQFKIIHPSFSLRVRRNSNNDNNNNLFLIITTRTIEHLTLGQIDTVFSHFTG